MFKKRIWNPLRWQSPLPSILLISGESVAVALAGWEISSQANLTAIATAIGAGAILLYSVNLVTQGQVPLSMTWRRRLDDHDGEHARMDMENLSRQQLDWAEDEHGEAGMFASHEAIVPFLRGIQRENPQAFNRMIEILERNQQIKNPNEG